MKFTIMALQSALILAALAGSAAASSLKDTLRSAYNNSGLLEQNRALLRAADEDVATAITSLRPIVNYSAQFAHNPALVITPETLTFSLSAEWLLYDFGRSDLQIKSLKETVLSTRQSLISIEQDILLRAATAHLNHRRSAELVLVRTANVELIEQELKAAKDRFEVGEITKTDVALAEARLASARASLASARGDELRSAAEYMAAVGRAPHNLQAPSSLPNLPVSVDAAIARARTAHPNLKQIQYAVSAAEIGVEISNTAFSPSIKGALSLSASNSNDWDTISRNASITAGGVLYNGGKNEAATRKAMAQRDSVRAQLHVANLNIEQNLRNVFVQRDVASASRAASEQQIEASTVAFNGVREEASVGSRTTLDVLNAEQELLNAKNSQISAVIDEQIASYSVLAAMGELTAEKLKLGVKTYDPTEYYNLVQSAPNALSPEGAALDRILKTLSGK